MNCLWAAVLYFDVFVVFLWLNIAEDKREHKHHDRIPLLSVWNYSNIFLYSPSSSNSPVSFTFSSFLLSCPCYSNSVSDTLITLLACIFTFLLKQSTWKNIHWTQFSCLRLLRFMDAMRFQKKKRREKKTIAISQFDDA